MAEAGVQLHEWVGWAALFWDGSGSVNSAAVYTSHPTAWSTHLANIDDLPTANFQAFLMLYRRDRHLYTVLIDGYDTVRLPGKTAPLIGLMLSEQKWAQLQQRTRNAWEHRGALAPGWDDWLNEVPS